MIPDITNDIVCEVTIGCVKLWHVAPIFWHGGHKELVVRVKTTRYHTGQENEPHHELLVGAILSNIRQNQIEIDYRHVVTCHACSALRIQNTRPSRRSSWSGLPLATASQQRWALTSNRERCASYRRRKARGKRKTQNESGRN